jgi:hypothetical protein
MTKSNYSHPLSKNDSIFISANAYCCKNWQHFNNDAVHTKIQSALVPQEHTVTIGYQDCNGNINPTRMYITIKI